MIGEVVAVLSALKMLNDGIKTVKETGNNLESLCGSWADATEKVQDVERKKNGVLSYRDAIALEGAKRQLIAFDRALQDVCLMQGQGELYASIKGRIAESKYAHEKELRDIKIRRRERKRLFAAVATAIFSWAFFMAVIIASIFFYRNK
jgi:hypothetical protein|tara:strand:+ start:1387 stop:1833 length:447 start_codon:yes stop_codon:yes gene_type:complete